MDFITTGDIAKHFHIDLADASYAVRRLGIKPVGHAGHIRLFPKTAIKQVKHFLANKRAHAKREAV
ncbi:hypothetical protein ACFL6U_09820 [Planctomycetota bacterium]